MSRQDVFSLGRSQRADVFCASGTLRRIADHPLNAPLIGICSAAKVERSTEVAAEDGDRTVVIYVARAGREQRAACATVRRRADGAVLLADWRVEAGFAHRAESVEGTRVHTIVTAPALTTPADAPEAARARASAPRTGSR